MATIPNLPDTPINSTVLLAATAVAGVAAYMIKRGSEDRQHQANVNLEVIRLVTDTPKVDLQ